ncbi:hypothetical protein ACP4OV_005356 [Aristida adscensionis]
MAKPSTIATMAVVLLAAAFFPGAVVGDANFVASTCKSSDNAHCVEVLGSDPRSVNATTVKEHASIALDVAGKNADACMRAIGYKAVHNSSGDRDALRVCADTYYLAALNDLDDARPSFDEGSYDGAEVHVGPRSPATSARGRSPTGTSSPPSPTWTPR